MFATAQSMAVTTSRLSLREIAAKAFATLVLIGGYPDSLPDADKVEVAATLGQDVESPFSTGPVTCTLKMGDKKFVGTVWRDNIYGGARVSVSRVTTPAGTFFLALRREFDDVDQTYFAVRGGKPLQWYYRTTGR